MKALTISAAVAILAILTLPGHAQMVKPESLTQGFILVVEDQSKSANASKPIHFAGSINSWDPGHPSFRLEPRSDTRWQFIFEQEMLSETVEFKLTLGGWATVELDADGQQISNRQFPLVDVSKLAPGEKPIIEIVVPQFSDGNEEYLVAFEYRPIEATGTVKRLEVAGGAGGAAGSMRDLLVWLPPEYDVPENADKQYPVVYMMDGQNLFQNHAEVPGEWRADETATALIEQGLVEPFIIVGVPHDGNDHRWSEYMPPSKNLPERYAELADNASGDDHVTWLINEVMPRVNRAFRVSTDREHTGIGGASLGGTIALYAALTEPDHFGLVLAESPFLGAFSEAVWSLWGATDPGGRRIFLGMGGDERLEGSDFWDDEGTHIDAIIEAAARLSSENDVALNIVTRHVHDENAWAERLPGAFSFLFGTATAAAADEEPADEVNESRVPDPSDLIDPQRLEQGFTLVVKDESGLASPTNPIFFASNENDWNAEDEARKLTLRSDGLWAIELDRPEISQRVEFKFTMGGWGRVETAPDGSPVSNRTLPQVDVSTFPKGDKPEIRFVVPAFSQPEDVSELLHGRDRTQDFTGDIRTMVVAGGAGRASGMERELQIWLPEGYDARVNRDTTYPVLYMMDGQNIFSVTPGLPGEWHADETATEMVASGQIEPLIIVGVPNAGRFRFDEYLPFGDLPGAEPSGEEFVRWLTGTVMPAVEREYRVDHRRENIGIGGSSLGGLISLYAATMHADHFGRAIIESCSKIGDDAEGDIQRMLATAKERGMPVPEKIYFGMGSREVSFSDRDTERNALYRQWATDLHEWLGDYGVAEEDRMLVIGEGHHHHELDWAERFTTALVATSKR
ncbi:MAG: alpha/beta hydrolase-fold protein [Planctomycetota bacterium]